MGVVVQFEKRDSEKFEVFRNGEQTCDSKVKHTRLEESKPNEFAGAYYNALTYTSRAAAPRTSFDIPSVSSRVRERTGT